MKKALIIVDLQNDFLQGGALPVKQGHLIIPIVNQLIHLPFDLKVATKDWHPKNHISFASQHQKKPGEKIELAKGTQILWPDHCIEGTYGASFAKGLQTEQIESVFYKGQDKEIDSYSAFFDNYHLKSTRLYEYLKKKGIEELFIAGLATDYCVKYSVLDAINLGFRVYVIQDACRAVNLKEKDEKLAFDEMQAKGAILIQSQGLDLKTLK